MTWAAQMQIYRGQANTLVDNAGVIQAFGARNRRMAQDIANLVGNQECAPVHAEAAPPNALSS
jgi:type IV secretory pathway TraG/TraD family ATPase VirD4